MRVAVPIPWKSSDSEKRKRDNERITDTREDDGTCIQDVAKVERRLFRGRVEFKCLLNA